MIVNRRLESSEGERRRGFIRDENLDYINIYKENYYDLYRVNYYNLILYKVRVLRVNGPCGITIFKSTRVSM